MRDFPFFPTEYGVAGLILREIPYRKEAYIRLLEVQPGMEQELLRECAAFCRMAGAEKIYAAGEGLEAFPVFTVLLEMRGTVTPADTPDTCLFPVTEETASRWRSIYNEAMARVDTARTLEARDEKQLTGEPGAYFIHEEGTLLGIGWLRENRLLAVVSVQRGSGERILRTLAQLLEGESMVLDVASTNAPAIRLYEKLGMISTGELVTWHDCTGFGR